MRTTMFGAWTVFALVIAGCGGGTSPTPSSAGLCSADTAVVVAMSDYSSSSVGGFGVAGPSTPAFGVDLGKDPQLTASNGHAFFLARDNDLVVELDACGTPTARRSVHQDGAPGTANPHDVALALDGSLFVVLYNVPRIAFIKDGKPDGFIDTSRFDPDGNPQADAIRMVNVGGAAKAFVTLERLDDHDQLRSKQASKMLRIDVATRIIEADIDLAGRNPFNPMAEHDGALFLAEPGNFDAADELLAGIERFETGSSTTRLLVAERDLGGSVAEIAVTDGCGAAIVAGPLQDVNPTSLVTFDPVTGRVLTSAALPVLGPTKGYDLQGLAWRGMSLYVGDRRSAGAGYHVHVFDRDPGTCTLHENARGIDLPQRPVALRAVR